MLRPRREVISLIYFCITVKGRISSPFYYTLIDWFSVETWSK